MEAVQKQHYAVPTAAVVEVAQEGVVCTSAKYNGFNDEQNW